MCIVSLTTLAIMINKIRYTLIEQSVYRLNNYILIDSLSSSDLLENIVEAFWSKAWKWTVSKIY